MTITKQSLLEAAKAVIKRWDSPRWNWDIHTGVYIEALRQAVQDAEVYTPMTDDEMQSLSAAWEGDDDSEYCWEHYIERAVIERLRIRWGG